jgi:hypothetical protein
VKSAWALFSCLFVEKSSPEVFCVAVPPPDLSIELLDRLVGAVGNGQARPEPLGPLKFVRAFSLAAVHEGTFSVTVVTSAGESPLRRAGLIETLPFALQSTIPSRCERSMLCFEVTLL